jgi:hypothetical protein
VGGVTDDWPPRRGPARGSNWFAKMLAGPIPVDGRIPIANSKPPDAPSSSDALGSLRFSLTYLSPGRQSGLLLPVPQKERPAEAGQGLAMMFAGGTPPYPTANL